MHTFMFRYIKVKLVYLTIEIRKLVRIKFKIKLRNKQIYTVIFFFVK